MLEIVLDTETTGISVKEGHRIVEIGCIELDNLIPTKNKRLIIHNAEFDIEHLNNKLSKISHLKITK